MFNFGIMTQGLKQKEEDFEKKKKGRGKGARGKDQRDNTALIKR